MFIPASKEMGEKKLLSYLSCSHKFHKIENYNIFEMLKKKFGPVFQKLSLSSQNYGFGIRDPEKSYSGFRILDPGVKKASDPGSRIRNTDEIVCVCQLMAARAGA
jgi:hypothetical protein